MSDKKQIKSLIDNLYYEKLGAILSKISEWRISKDEFIEETYLLICNQISNSTRQKEHFLKENCSVLLEVLSEMKDLFSKFKVDPKSTLLKQNEGSKNQQSMFGSIKSQWGIRRASLTEVYNFSYTFNAILCKQMSEIEKNCGGLYQVQKKIQYLSKNSEGRFANKTHIMSIKNNKKYFELAKTQQISKIFNEEILLFNQLLQELQDKYEHILNSIKTMFYNIASNLSDLSDLYARCFGEPLPKDMIKSAKNYEKSLEKQLQEFSQNRSDQQTNISTRYQQYNKEFQQIIWRAIQQISVASWDIEIKQNCSNIEEEGEEYHPTKGILTMDNKFIVIRNELTIFGKQFSLVDSNIKKSEKKSKKKKKRMITEEDEVENEPEVIIKGKKKDEKTYIKFQSQERLDEFILHINKARMGTLI